MRTDFIEVASPQIGEEEILAVRETLLSGQYISGRRVEEFEKGFADYIGVKHAVGVSNCTAALHITLEAVGVQEGDEVIVPPLSFFATISSVLFHRAIPVFADIDLDDLCLSPESTTQYITTKTKAIIPVHLYGGAAKMDEFVFLSEKYGIHIVEDCAQAHGTEYKGKKVGGIGTAGTFSFFATKHITTGEGGMITTNDSNVAQVSKVLRNHGMADRDQHIRLGYNNRMTEIEAAMGLVQLRKLDQLNQKRISNSEYLVEKIKKLPWIHIPITSNNVKHTYFWCPVMVKESSGRSIEDLKDHLVKNKIGFRRRYKEPLYKQIVLKKIDPEYSKLHLPNVEKVAGAIIGLPNHPGLSQKQLDIIIEVLHRF
jgi:perosamine synthetase